MNLTVFIVALLAFGARKAYSRALGNDDVDNSIETAVQQSNAFDMQDWIKFTKTPPAKILQTLGSPVEIECEVMGTQVPTIQWIVGRMPLPDVEIFDSNVLAESSPTAIVRVRSVHIIDHILSEPRTYTCVGISGGKSVYASTTVYPQSKLNELLQLTNKAMSGPRKPRIIYNEGLHLDLVGSNIVLPCRVVARPRAEIYWMNNHGKLIEQNHRFKILPAGDLLISEFKWDDMGVYKCVARNSLGKDTIETFIYPVLKEEKK